MDAGTAAFSKVKSPGTGADATFNNGSVQTHQQFYQQNPPQQQQLNPQQYGSNYDLMSPNYSMTSNTNSGSRKASMTSQSAMTMNKLFRRNKAPVDPDGAHVQFDEENGADIQDIAGGNVSFDDITHIRDRGPYSMTGTKTLDTTPIIPTLGNGSNGSLSATNMSNIQYRKQMNHQMKMHLATGARAMSLAGGNPMNNDGNNDPRAMSFNSFSNGPRTMSLNPSMSMQNVHIPANQQPMPAQGPRAMSLNNRSQPYNNGPRAMSLRNGPPQMGYGQMGPNGGYMPMQNGPMPNGPMPNGPMQNGPMQNGMGQNMPRSMSLSSQQMMNGQMMPNGQMHMNGQMPMNGQVPMNNQMPMNNQVPMQNQMPINGQMPMNYPNRGSMNNVAVNQSSNDSLMNVVEEDEDEQSVGRANSKTTSSSKGKRIPPPLIVESGDHDDGNDENDMVYRFEAEDENDNLSLSRKSTLKKSNSMRLRKLNLFNNDDTNEADIEEEHTTTPIRGQNPQDQSPSFNVDNNYNTDSESLVKSGSDEFNRQQQKDKLTHVGANAANSSNANDVYFTANEFSSPGKSLPSPNVRDSLTSKDSSKKQSPLKQTTFPENSENVDDEDIESDYENDDTLNDRGSPKAIPKQASVRSLTENTAFHNFRQSSIKRLDDNGEVVGNPDDDARDTDESDKHDSTFSRENYQANPSTADTVSSANVPSQPPVPDKPFENNIRSTKVTDLMESPVAENEQLQRNASSTSISKKDSKRGSRNFSISSTSKSIFKRLSKSGKRSSSAGFDDEDGDNSFNDTGISSKRNSITSTPTSQRRASYIRGTPTESSAPIKFSKEELGIMTANNDLLNELELVTTELASSIKRELKLEALLKANNSNEGGLTSAHSARSIDFEEELRENSKTISDLQEKLTKERRLRFISEEHALLSENGQSPSPLKLNYEKTELYRQLLIKNDLCNQLQDKLNEYQEQETQRQQEAERLKQQNDFQDPELLDRFNELLKENAELKLTVVPDLERKLELSNQRGSKNLSPNRLNNNHSNRSFSLVNNSSFNESFDDDTIDQSEDQIEISSLKNQRNELREVITKLNSSHNYEMKLHQDKMRSMENKLREQIHINEKLSERFGGHSSHTNTDSNGNLSLNLNSSSNPNSNVTSANNSTSNLLLNNTKGGKLQGFSIVSPDKKLFDD